MRRKGTFMKCLIAEDDIGIQKLLLTMLAADFECTTVANGREAVDAVHQAIKEQAPYDLICMDIEMPEIDGQEALIEIRQFERSHGFSEHTRSKIMMTTVHYSGGHIMQAAKSGCDAYMVKPFSKHELLAEIEKLGFGDTHQTEKTTLLQKMSRFLS
jgi:two-component system chemotaxis response regulator CheY